MTARKRTPASHPAATAAGASFRKLAKIVMPSTRTRKPAPLYLTAFEHVVTAWGERCAGPGWANHPVWVLIRDVRDGKLRIDCVQPADQSDAMSDTFPWSALAHQQMCRAAEALARKEKA